jgi:hypothetical protein
MGIIAITREMGALGEETAAAAASKAGYRLVDREAVEAELEKRGIDREKRERFDEKKPSFWASLLPVRDDYLHFLKSAIYREALEGDRVFLGRGAGAILAGIPGLLSIRLIAPKPVRIARIKAGMGCDERTAEKLIHRSDHDRQGYHHYFFSLDWSDPGRYTAVLNTADAGPEACASAILALQAAGLSPSDDIEAKRRLTALNLSQAVITEILYARKLPIQFLEAEALGGKVTLHGVSASRAVIDLAAQAAREVPGVLEVVSEMQVIQEYTVLP